MSVGRTWRKARPRAIEKITSRVTGLSRSQLKKKLRSLKTNFPMDFSEEYLDSLSNDRLRHILVAAYLNAGLDHKQALRHREWCKLNQDGQVYQMQTTGHFFRKMCLNTAWGPHLLSMVEEVLERCPVDSLFLDCLRLDPWVVVKK